MRKLGIQQIEDIALGASLLGAGGGGDPYIGKLMAIGAIRECGEVTLVSPEEVPDDALIMPIAMMGAPTVLCEKGIGGTEYRRIFEMVERYFGRKVYATMPMEAGGVNSMLPSRRRRASACPWSIATAWAAPFRNCKWLPSPSAAYPPRPWP